MMESPDFKSLAQDFIKGYKAEEKDKVWNAQSKSFRDFWNNKVLSKSDELISDDECDEIIKILDRNV